MQQNNVIPLAGTSRVGPSKTLACMALRGLAQRLFVLKFGKK